MTKQEAYCEYLRDWADSHEDSGFEGCTPASYDEWLDNEGAEGKYDEPASSYKPHFPAIETVRNKYGEELFRMALTYLFDAGHSHIDEENAEETKRDIMAEKPTGTPVMTPGFQCHIIDAALELKQLSVWTLLAYVKTQVFIQ